MNIKKNRNLKGNGDKKSLKSWLISFLILLLIVGVYAFGWLSLAYTFKTNHPITVVNGHSMLPTLNHGDIVILKGVSIEELIEDFKEGKKDIIVYKAKSGRYIIHRIYDLKYDKDGKFLGFIVKGDNNPVPDPELVTSEKVVGKVIGRLFPYLGIVIIFAGSLVGHVIILAIIIFLVVLVLLDELKSLGKPKPKSINKP